MIEHIDVQFTGKIAIARYSNTFLCLLRRSSCTHTLRIRFNLILVSWGAIPWDRRNPVIHQMHREPNDNRAAEKVPNDSRGLVEPHASDSRRSAVHEPGRDEEHFGSHGIVRLG